MPETRQSIQKICVFTGTRAEYGLLRPLLKELKADPELVLQIMVSGMHLSQEFGMTYQEIEKDGFFIDEKIEMLLSSDSSTGICKSAGLGMISFGEALERLGPDMVVILGDRFETFAVTACAMLKQIPTAHIHGGEITRGAIDDQIRHAVTKMSHVHFTSTENYRKRVIQLGEDPEFVHNVGALGVENIRKVRLLTGSEFEDLAGFHLPEKSFLVTFHPVTLEKEQSLKQLDALFRALDQFKDYFVIFTKANADEQGRSMNRMIDAYCGSRGAAFSVTSLGQLLYLNALQRVKAVIGNSSSGIIEAPTFKIPTVNIGSRQDGRIKPASVIDCEPSEDGIVRAIKKSLSSEFVKTIQDLTNPYEKENTAQKIKQILKSVRYNHIIKKTFYDLNPIE